MRADERLRRYGLSAADYAKLLARQNGACGICKRSGRALCIDHCHLTGKVRGLLCHKCNRGLGHYDDNPVFTQAATAYLARSLGDELIPLAWIGRLIAVVLLLAAWKAAAHLDLLDRLLLPSPRRIGAAALELLAGVVWPGAETTVTAALGGPAPGIAIGIVIGVIAAAALRPRQRAHRRPDAAPGARPGHGRGRPARRRNLQACRPRQQKSSRLCACAGKTIAIDPRRAPSSFAPRSATPYPCGSPLPSPAACGNRKTR